jgi:AbrB family looped-hinge helix DNA binding protein
LLIDAMPEEKRIVTTRMDANGRIEIPESVRKELGVEEGQPFFIAARDRHLILRPVSELFVERAKEIDEKNLTGSVSTDRYSKNSYVCPVPKDKIINSGSIGYSGAHQGRLVNSIDFWVPEGTEIYAAADGIVESVKKDSKVGGPELKYWGEGNNVQIAHANGERTCYEHMEFEGAVVKAGDAVKAGQVIGYSGRSGFTSRPMVHFEVYEYFGKGEEDYVTLKVRFSDFRDVYKINSN